MRLRTGCGDFFGAGFHLLKPARRRSKYRKLCFEPVPGPAFIPRCSTIACTVQYFVAIHR
jgi:hypothetical protein